MSKESRKDTVRKKVLARRLRLRKKAAADKKNELLVRLARAAANPTPKLDKGHRIRRRRLIQLCGGFDQYLAVRQRHNTDIAGLLIEQAKAEEAANEQEQCRG